jgi:sugar phosphate isomerase/epimerase
VPKLAAFPKGFFTDLMERRMTLLQWIDLAGRLGLDGTELYPRFFDSFEPPYVARVKDALARARLAMPMMCHSPDFTRPDAAGRAEELDYTRRVIDLTAALGGRYTRVLSGQNRPGLDPTQALGWVIDAIRSLVPYARERGIQLVIENHYKDGLWEYPEFAQKSERYLAILEGVPELGAQYDPSNAVVAGEDPYALLEKILPRVTTMQASDRYLEGGTLEDLRRMEADPRHGYATILKHGVTGRGLNDYDRIFSTLARAGYDGWISIEDGEGPTIEIGTANLRDSAAFLRRKIAEHFR